MFNGPSWTRLGLSWACLWPSWVCLRRIWAHLDPSWACLGSFWGRSWGQKPFNFIVFLFAFVNNHFFEQDKACNCILTDLRSILTPKRSQLGSKMGCKTVRKRSPKPIKQTVGFLIDFWTSQEAMTILLIQLNGP